MKNYHSAIIICISIITTVLLIIFVLSEYDIQYSIKLTSNYIPEGSNLTVNYKITNGIISGDKNNVTFLCWIENNTHKRIGYIYRVYLGTVKNGDELNRHLMVPTNFLEVDTYDVYTQMIYGDNLKTMKAPLHIY